MRPTTISQQVSYHSIATHPYNLSDLQQERLKTSPIIPEILQGYVEVVVDDQLQLNEPVDAEELKKFFPSTWKQPLLRLVKNKDEKDSCHQPLRIGIVLSGGQAPGGHNVIAGVFDYIKRYNCHSQLFGFLGGPSGIFQHKYVEITDHMMDQYRNLGGFDMILSGRHKVETQEQKLASLQVARKLDLHGIVVVGGDDSNTNAAILAEYLTANGCSTKVIGVPKTIDGDLKNQFIETSFGFDTAIKTYSEFIGNLAMDIASSKKYYHFVRLMGRAASNITLHCGLLTRPNYMIIGEEIEANNTSLSDIIKDLVNLIINRKNIGKNYGIILVPEGLIEFIPEIGILIQEINNILATKDFSDKLLTPESFRVFNSLPPSIRSQLLLDRDPHGNVQVSRIATERLLILMIKAKLTELGHAEDFLPRSHFFGYEGRAGLPSIFDSNYCYALGMTAAALIEAKKTGYMAFVRHLSKPTEEWVPGGCPIPMMMNMEIRKGIYVPVIKKYLVEIDKEPFILFKQVRKRWECEDYYTSPGPLQFHGPCANIVNFSIKTPTLEDLLPEQEFGFQSKKKESFFPKSISQLSPLQKQRLNAPIHIPSLLLDRQASLITNRKFQWNDPQTESSVVRGFLLQCSKNKNQLITVTKDVNYHDIATKNLRIGVLLNGQQAPGCANVLIGLWSRLSIESRCGTLIGFLGGITGFMSDPPQYIEITSEHLSMSRNQGGFDLLGRAPEAEMMIVTSEGIEAARRVCTTLKLDGLVLLGGTLTLTDVAVLTEDFLKREIPTNVIGIPVTQNNNIDSSIIECSIGFDSASKCYSQLIGNLNTDGASSAKYWMFVRLMGSSKSQIVAETSLATHPNITLISEAYAAGDKTLKDVVSHICDVIIKRAENGLNFGTIIIPEGLISFLPQFRQLILELKTILCSLDSITAMKIVQQLVSLNENGLEEIGLSPWSRALLRTLPEYFRQQLVQPRSLGSLELTKIATEELLSEMVSIELRRREKAGKCQKVNFMPLCFYFGYQGRSSLPTLFDCSLGMAHGALAALAIKNNHTGFATCIRGLAASPTEWIPILYPVTAFLKPMPDSDVDVYPRKISRVPVDMVRLNGKSYQKLLSLQLEWETENHYCNPGPIQFDGSSRLALTQTLKTDHQQYLNMLAAVRRSIEILRRICGSGVNEALLQTAVTSLSVLCRVYES